MLIGGGTATDEPAIDMPACLIGKQQIEATPEQSPVNPENSQNDTSRASSGAVPRTAGTVRERASSLAGHGYEPVPTAACRRKTAPTKNGNRPSGRATAAAD